MELGPINNTNNFNISSNATDLDESKIFLNTEGSLSTCNKGCKNQCCLGNFFGKILSFFKWLFQKIFCIETPQELKPIPKEIDDYWNGVIQLNDDLKPSDTLTQHYFCGQLAIACKLAGIKKCRFERIFANNSGGALHVWFRLDQLESYGAGPHSKQVREGKFNNPQTLFIRGTRSTTLQDREDFQRNGRTYNPEIANAQFYQLTYDDVLSIRDYRKLPDHLRAFLEKE